MGVVWGVAGVSLISFIFTSIWYIDPALLTMVLQFQPATCTTVHRYTVHCTLYTVYSSSHLYYCTQVYCTLYTIYSSSHLQYCTPVYSTMYTVPATCTSVHCTLVHCTLVHCTVVHCTLVHCTVVHCTGVHCTVVHCTVVHCTVVHCTLYTVPATCTIVHRYTEHCTLLYCTYTVHCIQFQLLVLLYAGILYIVYSYSHL